mmetsp:Transcript_66731/g.107459  ORF Transcript_66731/g.107459 Transcript_66731/m.107459 type:complete len:84 (-) Transcript_66731:467-718(-)
MRRSLRFFLAFKISFSKSGLILNPVLNVLPLYAAIHRAWRCQPTQIPKCASDPISLTMPYQTWMAKAVGLTVSLMSLEVFSGC